MKEEQRAMSKKTSKLVKSNVFLIVLLIFGSVGLGLTIMNEQAKTVAETTSVVQESNVDTRKLIEKVSDTAVVTDGKGDYLLAFKGHEDEDNAGVSTRAYGDHFTATAQNFDGALIQCLPITEVARMVTNLVNGVSTHLVMTDEDDLETNILPTDGDYEDRGDTLSFGEHFYVLLDSDACNQPQPFDRNLRSSAAGNAATTSTTSTLLKPSSSSRAAVLKHNRDQFILARKAIKEGRKLRDYGRFQLSR